MNWLKKKMHNYYCKIMSQKVCDVMLKFLSKNKNCYGSNHGVVAHQDQTLVVLQDMSKEIFIHYMLLITLHTYWNAFA